MSIFDSRSSTRRPSSINTTISNIIQWLDSLSNKKEFLFVCILFSIIVFGITISTGTLNCGFHFVDDHEFLKYYIDSHIHNLSFWDILSEEMERDLSLRFRPLYYPIRVLIGSIFGINLTVLSILKAIETVISFIIIYYLSKCIKLTRVQSIISGILIMVGPQSAIWWKLGPQESTATWIYMLGIILSIRYFHSSKRIYNILALLCYSFTSLYKESYLLLIPSIILIYIYHSLSERSSFNLSDIFKSIKQNVNTIIFLSLLFIATIICIIIGPGTGRLGYISFDNKMRLYDYAVVMFNNLRYPLRIGTYVAFGLITIILITNSINKLKNYIWNILIALAIILPQMVMYSKPGIEERYVNPWIFGVVYLFYVIIMQSKALFGIRLSIYKLALIGLLAFQFTLVFSEASYYTYRAHSISKLWDATLKLSDPDTIILSAFAPYEESDKTNSYWFYYNNRTNIYVYRDGICSGWYGPHQGDIVDISDVDIILFYNPLDRHYIYTPDIDFSGFEIINYGSETMAIRSN